MANEYQPLLNNEQYVTQSGAIPSQREVGSGNNNDKISIWTSLMNTAKCSYINVLTIFIPIGILFGKLSHNETLIFVFNFIAIIPLAKLLGYATEEISIRTSETIGGLLNATFGNAVELIVGIIALYNGYIDVVQASMIGSLLSNLLLVLGFCFFCGGLKYKVQSFNITSSNTSASLLTMTVLMIILPVTFSHETKDSKDGVDREIMFSRYTSVVMLILYFCYLLFQLKTHAEFFRSNTLNPLYVRNSINESEALSNQRRSDEEGNEQENEIEEESEEPHISAGFAIALLLAITLLISVCADYLVDSIDGISANWGISTSFVGLILLPIVGNAAEHVTAVTVAMKNKMDLAISVALGSSMQIALLIIPSLVIIGWIINQPMSLVFSLFESVVIFISTYVVNQLINDGRSNWLEGTMLLGAYFIVAVAYWFM